MYVCDLTYMIQSVYFYLTSLKQMHIQRYSIELTYKIMKKDNIYTIRFPMKKGSIYLYLINNK